MDKGHWPRCLLWHGWLPKLSGVNGASPWADSAAAPVGFDAVEAASLLPDSPNVWTDGSLVLDRVTGVSSSGAGFFAHQPVSCWDHRCWGHVDPVRPVGDLQCCQGFCAVPGPLQPVRRAILALQSSGAVHLGVDNLSVVRHVGRLLDGRCGSVPFELVKDGDLLVLIERMLHLWTLLGLLRLRVMLMRVWFLTVGFGRLVMTLLMRLLTLDVVELAILSLMLVVICLGSVVAGTLLFLTFIGFSLPFLELCFIMMVGMVLLWYGLQVLVLEGVVRDGAFLPGPTGIWDSEWVAVPPSVICADDIAHWPYTPGLLVKWVAFLGTLHWPAGCVDLGVGGVSCVELLILYELWAGERLSLEKAQPRYLRLARPLSVSAVPFGPGIDIWRSCRFIGALMRSLCLLPGGLARFVPCFIGANHCGLRHIGWEECGHGLTSRPRESASAPFLDELLFLFRYPVGSGHALLARTLPLRYCFDRFACRTPTWRLPASGGVVDLVTANVADGHRVVPAAGRREVFGVGNSGLRRKRIRLNRFCCSI